jgi:tRNA/tmRNA/rRNA uracil-C5-methylase (TrmA/RlmC/RlmD family)
VECPHRPPCPGCPRFGQGGISAGAQRALAELARAAGLAEPRVAEGEARGYRHRARLAVRGRAAAPAVGIFRAGTHRVIDIPHCLVHHPRVNEVAAALRSAVRATGIPPYADAAHRGCLRYLQVVVERETQRAQVVLVANSEGAEAVAPLAEALSRDLGPRLHSLWWNGQRERTNAILGAHWQRLLGPAAVRESIGGAEVFYPPGAFGQANLALADQIVARVQAFVPEGARVAELHAGVGAIGLGLARRGHRVAFNEASADARAGLALGIAALPAAARARTEVWEGPAARHLDALAGADVVICDPPRKGLEPELLAHLAASPPPRIVLISCSLDAFLREAHALQGGGRTALRALAAFALFPYTDHVETLALFERVAAAPPRTVRPQIA